MNIQIDTVRKTLSLKESCTVKKLLEFMETFKISEDYSLLVSGDTFIYPIYPTTPTFLPFPPENPEPEIYKITCVSKENDSCL